MSAPPVISVIDDDAAVRAATRNLLIARGYVVHAFASGEDFLLSPELRDISCVIADIQMPGMSGLDLMAHMRGNGNHTPFIFMTAFPDDRVRARALKEGAIGFLAKPFAPLALLSCLDQAMKSEGGGT
ncbi:response regulator [Bradyrhizobium sp. ARR65]|uniref:response regulator transcription factor n=1 Tax=Bradyrhizobium sp. ARR65 TaxID=1040989 RepID=UPI0004653EDE|nr:response regulator [Bradyrhizobium sp. ARR65]